ncbi:hypothetical protein E0Z10_g10373 [Xylaria hypoxylon]|uniref:Uncharacterized protein n=1 Tax=Xylaria hypoxylon TaxID=37992 RepID=A0A4Z0YHJ8_9PEZI|nr:hypothetical protein E0Z10_g10373 [Xylaria hypoxylon]
MGNRLTKSNAAYSDSNEINTTGPSIGPSANGNASLIAGHSDHENKTTANASSQTAPLPCKPMPARSIPYAGYRLVFVADERRDEYVSGYKADDEGDGEKIKKQKLSRARRKKHTFKRYWAGEDELDPKRSENIKSDDDD